MINNKREWLVFFFFDGFQVISFKRFIWFTRGVTAHREAEENI